MTTTTDESALLAAIAAHPDEDTPRLMYADWLDENDQPERAEFIRLQIALVQPASETKGKSFVGECWQCASARTGGQHTNAACKCDPARKVMQARVDEIWSSRQFCILIGFSEINRAYEPSIGIPERLLNKYAFVSRGFVGDLYFPRMVDVCERAMVTCNSCGGRGSRWVSQSAPVQSGVTGLLGQYIPCDECPLDYTGKPTKLALDTMRAHPTITRVVVGDQRPTRQTASIPGRGQYFYYYRILADVVPRFIVDLLGENRFADEVEAADALAVAAGQWLRREAGI